jgi:pyruvate dehydrogenase E2 component (dihydrolipoamide acetyltransferase)
LVTDVVLPHSGLEVSEGAIVSVDVAVGDRVAEGDRLLEVETDKAMSDVVAPRDGIVVGIEVAVGDTVEVGARLVRLGDGEEDVSDPAEPDGASDEARNGTPRDVHRIRAAPLARRAAEHLGVALQDVTGTGPRGRITLADVERAAAGAARSHEPLERIEPMSATRRAIARRITASQEIPQFTLHRDVDATWLLAEKQRLSDAGPKVGVNDLLVQSLAETVVRHPDLGASYVPPTNGGQPGLRRRDGVDVGLAVATDRGLLVPVIRRAHERTLAELARDRVRLVEAARDGLLDRAEMTGATISLSSLAAFGVDRFDAMLNPGESAILAVGRTVERVVPTDRGLAIVPTLTISLTVDHRVIDGATGGRALAELAQLLEGGMAWRV